VTNDLHENKVKVLVTQEKQTDTNFTKKFLSFSSTLMQFNQVISKLHSIYVVTI